MSKIGETVHYREGSQCRAGIVLSYCKIALPKRDEYGAPVVGSDGKIVYTDFYGIEMEILGTGGTRRTLLPGPSKTSERYHTLSECEG